MPVTTSASNEGIRGLAGVLVWTAAERFPAMARFYRETLGLTPRSIRSDFVNFDWRGVRLSLGVHDGVRGPSPDPLRIMVNLAVDDIGGVVARLEAAGVVFSRRPEREKWGGLVATFADPDGNVLQLLQLPRPRSGPGASRIGSPGVRARRPRGPAISGL